MSSEISVSSFALPDAPTSPRSLIPDGGAIVIAAAAPATMTMTPSAPADTDGAVMEDVDPAEPLEPSTGVVPSTPTYAAITPVVPCAEPIVNEYVPPSLEPTTRTSTDCLRAEPLVSVRLTVQPLPVTAAFPATSTAATRTSPTAAPAGFGTLRVVLVDEPDATLRKAMAR